MESLWLCLVNVSPDIMFISFEEISLDETLNPRLDGRSGRIKPIGHLLANFLHKLVVCERLSGLHDPHNNRIQQKTPFLFNHSRHIIPQLINCRVLCHNQRDLNTSEFGGKLIVKSEYIFLEDILIQTIVYTNNNFFTF
jgi:hypothetical protein